jgi:hypothetical protein
VLTQKLKSKLNEPVHGKIVDPVYVFDRQVIPSGTEILGKVTALQSVGKWKRVSSMLAGDFTPLHDPEITFDMLVLPDGKEIPINTSVVSRGNVLVRFDKGKTRAFTTTIQEPGKDLVHRLLWGLSPYHPQSISIGTTYKATLETPLEFGNAIVGSKTLTSIGSTPEAGAIISARLLTSLDSKTTTIGTTIQAVLMRPLYSVDQRLIYPAGSRMQGMVVEAKSAGFWNHSGKLDMKFTKIEPPLSVMTSMSQIREIDGRLVGVEVPLEFSQLRIKSNGLIEIERTNGRFLAPAFAVVGATPILGSNPSGFGTAVAESYGTNFISRMTGGGNGFGMPGSIAGMMVPPVGLGLGAYGVTRSVYSNIIGHGKNITLPVDTPIEVRID